MTLEDHPDWNPPTRKMRIAPPAAPIAPKPTMPVERGGGSGLTDWVAVLVPILLILILCAVGLWGHQ